MSVSFRTISIRKSRGCLALRNTPDTLWTGPRNSSTISLLPIVLSGLLSVGLTRCSSPSPTSDFLSFPKSVASAAVPGILNGVVLMQKTPQGDLKPMNFGSKFKDGSLRVDIPLESLHLLFNVNYSIVSQGRSSLFSSHFPNFD